MPKAQPLTHGCQSYKVVARAGDHPLVQYSRVGRVFSAVGYTRFGRGLSSVRKPRVGRVLSTVRSHGLGGCCPLNDIRGWGGGCPPSDIRGWGRGVSSFGNQWTGVGAVHEQASVSYQHKPHSAQSVRQFLEDIGMGRGGCCPPNYSRGGRGCCPPAIPLYSLT